MKRSGKPVLEVMKEKKSVIQNYLPSENILQNQSERDFQIQTKTLGSHCQET